MVQHEGLLRKQSHDASFVKLFKKQRGPIEEHRHDVDEVREETNGRMQKDDQNRNGSMWRFTCRPVAHISRPSWTQ